MPRLTETAVPVVPASAASFAGGRQGLWGFLLIIGPFSGGLSLPAEGVGHQPRVEVPRFFGVDIKDP